MNLLYFNVIEQHSGWGAEYFMNEALHRNGCDTFCVDYRKHRPRLALRSVRAPKCDGLFMQRGDNIPRYLLDCANIPAAFWISELVERVHDFHHLLAPPRLFEHLFVRTPRCIEAITKMGAFSANQCSIFLGSYDASVYHPLDCAKEFDLLFVGTAMPRRQKLFDKLRSSGLSVHVASAFGREANTLFNRARIILNVHAEEPLDTETRVYEALGSGGFLLSEKLSSENPFSDREVVQAESHEDMIEKAHYYLKHETERVTIAEQGQRTAQALHTYDVRAREVITLFQSILAKRGAVRSNFNNTRLLLSWIKASLHQRASALKRRVIRT